VNRVVQSPTEKNPVGVSVVKWIGSAEDAKGLHKHWIAESASYSTAAGLTGGRQTWVGSDWNQLPFGQWAQELLVGRGIS